MKVILTRSHSISSALIRARLGDRWSHGLVAIGDECIDATFKLGGVRKRPLADAIHGASSRCELLFPVAPHLAHLWLEGQLGKGYDWRAIWGFASADREWRDESSWYCFELIAGAIEAASPYRFRDLGRVTPADLFEAAAFLQAHR